MLVCCALSDAVAATGDAIGDAIDYVAPAVENAVTTGFELIGEATVATADAVASVVNSCESDSPTRPADEVSCPRWHARDWG